MDESVEAALEPRGALMARQRKTTDAAQKRWGGLEYEQVVAAVANLFCQGILPSGIPKRIKDDFGIDLSREAPWAILGKAAADGRLRYVAPLDGDLAERIERNYSLKRVWVVNTSVMDDVAMRGAQVLLNLVRDRARSLRAAAATSQSAEKQRPQPKARNKRAGNGQPESASGDAKITVHIGLAGGLHLRRLAQVFAGLLAREPAEGMPHAIQFHSLIGDTPDGPSKNPNSFFVYFDQPVPNIEVSCHGLAAPCVVDDKDYVTMSDRRVIRKAFAMKGDLHIVVFGLGRWKDPHNALREMLEKESPESLQLLKEKQCVGDLLWRPLGPEGPITEETPVRAFTLFKEIEELSGCIDRGVDVVLAAGPCAVCHEPKPETLKVVLNLDPPVITHLVADSRSVGPIVAARAQ